MTYNYPKISIQNAYEIFEDFKNDNISEDKINKHTNGDFLNIAISPPAIVDIKYIFDNEEIKYDAEKSSIAVVFATGNLFMNTSIILIRLIRTLCENGYDISIYIVEKYTNYYIKEVTHTEGISDYNIINNDEDVEDEHDAALENIINDHEKND